MLHGFIMSGDLAVAQFSGRVVDPIIPSLAPLCFQKGGDLEWWLETRAIDKHRTNSRILKRILRLGDTSDLNTVLRVHGATITDNYWVRTSKERELTWKDVRFSENYFADIALRGTFAHFSQKFTPKQLRSPTPELTNIGSYEKCWKRLDGKWVMLKKGTEEEIFSELLISRLGKLFGFPMAHYYQLDEYIATDDFTTGSLNFEPMANILQDNEEYADNYDALFSIRPSLAKEYLDILFMDALVFNVDRHTQNYGVLRSQTTGEILSMAPNFDNNMALISRGYVKELENVSNLMIDLFHDLLRQRSIQYQYPVLHDSALQTIAYGTMPKGNIDRKYVVDFVRQNYARLTES